MTNLDEHRRGRDLFPCAVPWVRTAEKNRITTAGVPPKIRTSHHHNTCQIITWANLLGHLLQLLHYSTIPVYADTYLFILLHYGPNRERLVIPQYQHTDSHWFFLYSLFLVKIMIHVLILVNYYSRWGMLQKHHYTLPYKSHATSRHMEVAKICMSVQASHSRQTTTAWSEESSANTMVARISKTDFKLGIWAWTDSRQGWMLKELSHSIKIKVGNSFTRREIINSQK